jgi:serine/threonine protein kinase
LENQFATTPCLVIPHPLAFCTVNSGVSFCRWKESTLTLPYESSKTAWPVSQTESFFLPEFPLLTGDKEKKYKNLGEINKGAFGKVYRVEEEGRVYALKVLSKSKVSVFFFCVSTRRIIAGRKASRKLDPVTIQTFINFLAWLLSAFRLQRRIF